MLLSNLNLLATAPGGVARLRELILTLAVQGKLLAQDPGDEAASVLLEKIRAEKDRLIAAGKIKRDKPLAAIAEGEQPFEVPNGWEWVRCTDYFIELCTGPFGSMIHKEDYVYDGVPLINPSHMLGGKIVHDARVTVKPKDAERLFAYTLSAGDLVLARRGELGRYALVTEREHGWLCGTGSFFIRLHNACNREYLGLLFSDSRFRQHLLGESVGTTMTNLNQRILLDALIALPPLTEQARIVARVEELMHLCDALETKGQLEATQHAQLVATLLGTLADSQTPDALAQNWQRIASHFDLLLDRPQAVDALEQTILQLAVRGLLVPQDPGDEPASALLQKIRAEKDRLIAAGHIKRDKPLPPVAEEEKPFALPHGWEWARIDSVANVQGGIQKTPLRRPVNLHYPYLRVANVQRDELRLNEIERFELTEEELAKWRLIAGDLLIVEGNGSESEIGRCAVWTGELDPCVYQNHLIRVRCFEPECVEHLKLFLNAPSGMDEMKRLAITTSGLYNLSVGKIRNFAVPLPPLPEQSRIVARVQALRGLCADLRQRLAASRVAQAQLAEALVSQPNG